MPEERELLQWARSWFAMSAWEGAAGRGCMTGRGGPANGLADE